MANKERDSNSEVAESTTSELPAAQRELKKKLAEHFSSETGEISTHAWKHYGLSYLVRRSELLSVMTKLRDEEAFSFEMLVDVTCVDYMDKREPRFDVVYQLMSLKHKSRLCVKVQVDEDEAEVDSMVGLWAGANFLEREAWDMFGVSFKGHPDLRRILMYDEFVGYPLRKDYPKSGKQPRIALRVPELRNTSADMKREQLVALPVRQRIPTAQKQ
jgi:NADH-quinone oxidoreductase subunit C